MIKKEDISSAINEGILSEEQAAKLITYSDQQRRFRANLSKNDEPFELFHGFNEIFILFGLLIVTSGWAAITFFCYQIGNAAMYLSMYGIAAIILWALSEYFIKIRRMIGPAILLTILWALNVSILVMLLFFDNFLWQAFDAQYLSVGVCAVLIAVLLYWWRFYVPFALAIIAFNIIILSIAITALIIGPVQNYNPFLMLSSKGFFAWVVFAMGLGIFICAMAFDMSDPHRVTRRAANGFWLHMVAAPALISNLAVSLLDLELYPALFIVIIIFALVAIVIDRRSFLIAAVGYCIVMAYTLFGDWTAAIYMVALGMTLLFLGAFWAEIRAFLLRVLSPILPISRLPPSIGL